MDRRVVVTGVGVISPVGNNKSDFWNSIINGESGVRQLTSFDASNFSSRIAGEVKNFDPLRYLNSKDLKKTDRFVQFALAAAKEAIEDAKLSLDEEDPYRVGVLVGSGIGSLFAIEQQHKILLEKGPSRISPFLIPRLIVNMASGQISISFKIKGPNFSIVTACASGTHAIGEAFRIIQRQEAEVMIAGGTESCITPLGVGGFCAMKALSTRNDNPEKASRPFDKERDGFIMAEGAGVVILESLDHAKGRSCPNIYAEILGYGTSGDAYHMTAPEPSGESPAKCMENALKDAGMKPEQISYINAHGTSTQLNDKVETQAIKKVFGEYAKRIPVSATKSMTGHLLGAAGGVEFIICTLAICQGIIPPTINYEYLDPECDLDYVPNKARRINVETALTNSFGFGGHNASLILGRFKQ